jgi:sigma-B regulation protein RsbU (phosphoserine phosphatase)
MVHAVAGLVGWWLARRFRRRFLAGWRVAVERGRDQQRLREELALARRVQLSMLPEAMPAIPWLDVAAVCLPADEVGGDYYDFFGEEDALVVAVADVAGHGLASGLVLATVRSGLALLMEESAPDEHTLQRLDRLIRRGGPRMLVTLALARFDARRGEVSVTAAGHPPLLLRRAGAGSVHELGAPAVPLGTRLPATWRPAVAAFSPGDAFVLYSDGLVEAENAAGEAYGQARLEGLLTAFDPDAGAAALCAAIIGDLDFFLAGVAPEDDLTVVALVAR